MVLYQRGKRRLWLSERGHQERRDNQRARRDGAARDDKGCSGYAAHQGRAVKTKAHIKWAKSHLEGDLSGYIWTAFD